MNRNILAKPAIAGTPPLITQIRALERRVAQLSDTALRCHLESRTDGLTKAWNRTELLDRVLRWELKQTPKIIAFLDIDNFKLLNDSEGHAAGDKALVELAAIVAGSIRQSDFFCRLGGDEFVVVFLNTSVSRVLKKLERVGAEFKMIAANKISLSIGLADWVSGIGFELALERAESAMRQRKAEGKSGITAY